jgi:prepilin-type N-terminal cleavage/methylation domain-containing protein
MNAKFMFFLRPRAQGHGGGAERRGGAQRRRGFTLVEVIVVLVILAILAAIAIPALTGYIDKAQDKKYIADARNVFVATRAVISEMYTEESTIKDLLAANSAPDAPGFLEWGYRADSGGTASSTPYLKAGKRSYPITQLGLYTYNNLYFYNKITEMMSVPPLTTSYGGKVGEWTMTLVGPNTAGTTIFNADGFFYVYTPEDTTKRIVVTYKMKEIKANPNNIGMIYQQTQHNITTAYDVNEGYRLYETASS